MKNDQKFYCKDCGKSVGTKAHALQCEKCDEWLHAKCAGIPSDLYLLLKKYSVPRLKLFCQKCDHCDKDELCKPTYSDTDDTDTDVTCIPVTTCIPVSASTPTPSPDNTLVDPTPSNDILPKTYADAVTTRGSRKKTSTNAKKQATKPLRHDVPPPVQDIADRVRHLEEIITKHPPLGTASSSSSQRPNRDRCLIIMRAPESTKESPAERMLDDQNFLQAMVSTLFDDAEDGINVVSAFRLGKKHADPLSYPRPLKVVLKDSEEARRVFTRTSRLKGLDYRVLRNLCPDDRIRMRDAVQELKQRRSLGENNLQIVDFQVVVRRPRVVWHPVAILPRACLPN